MLLGVFVIGKAVGPVMMPTAERASRGSWESLDPSWEGLGGLISLSALEPHSQGGWL